MEDGRFAAYIAWYAGFDKNCELAKLLRDENRD